jgi:hypothetical protein
MTAKRDYTHWAKTSGVIRNHPPAPNSQLACSAPYVCGEKTIDPIVIGFYLYERNLVRTLMENLDQERIPGSVVEFGVFEGNALNDLATIREELNSEREIYGFDSFAGLPEPVAGLDSPAFYKGQFVSPLEVAEQKLRVSERPYLHLIKGWFSNTLYASPACDIEHVAYARIDCDLYESTVHCLDWLTSRLQYGGILVFDDWTYDLDIGETRAFYEWSKAHHEFSFEFIYYGMAPHLYLKVHKSPSVK